MSNINPLTQQPFSDAELAVVVKKANEFIALQAEIATIELILEQKQSAANALKLTILPQLMSDIGLNNFQMNNGATITIKPFYQCSVSDKDPILKEKALKWLRTNGAGSLIKHEFKAILGVDAEKLVASLRGFMNKKSIPFKDGQNVNAATLKSFMKEQVEAGKPFPMDIFKGYAGKIAEVDMPKN